MRFHGRTFIAGFSKVNQTLSKNEKSVSNYEKFIWGPENGNVAISSTGSVLRSRLVMMRVRVLADAGGARYLQSRNIARAAAARNRP
jgi:hypothetical protein